MSRSCPNDAYPPCWWSYREKDAWFEFQREHPEWAKAIGDLTSSIHFEQGQSDPILSAGAQVEVIQLRIAELLGLVEYDWCEHYDTVLAP